jgi:putative multiple sugar transport system permease protein
METVKNVFRNNLRQYGMLMALVAIIIFFQIATKGVLLVPMNVTNLILQNSYVIILAIGMTLCIVAGGHIDLSVGSVCAFVGAIVGILVINHKMNLLLAVAIALAIGLVTGIWQGFWIAYWRIPSFIVTLAGQLIFRGLTTAVLQGQTLAPFPEEYQKISNGFIPDVFGSGKGLNITALFIGLVFSVLYIILEVRKRAERKKYSFEISAAYLFVIQIVAVVGVINLFSLWLARYKGLPIIFVIIGVLIVIYSIFMNRTAPGRYIYAMGGNEKAAKLSGVKVNKMLFLVFVNMAVIAAVAGMCFSARLNAASPLSGKDFELDAIAACFIGGASAYGGIGRISGAVIGALVMGVLNNGLSILGVSSDWTMAIKGFVLLLAVAFDVFSKRKTRA